MTAIQGTCGTLGIKWRAVGDGGYAIQCCEESSDVVFDLSIEPLPPYAAATAAKAAETGAPLPRYELQVSCVAGHRDDSDGLVRHLVAQCRDEFARCGVKTTSVAVGPSRHK